MSDDIDIEEHDILDNPYIRNIFPDLSVVKKEISEFSNEADNVKQEPEPSQCTPNPQTVLSKTFSNDYEVPTLINPNTSSTQSNVVVKNEFKQYQTNVVYLKNKIIIGSKPPKSLTPKATEKAPVNKQIRYPKVILHDVKSYLENNKRYCKDCMVLFHTSSQLCEHKRKRQVATENQSSKVSSKTQEGYKCRVCHIYISSKSNLKRHYNNVHKKILTHKSVSQVVETKTNNIKQQITDTKTQSTYHCKICKVTFNSVNSLNRHNRNVHLDVRKVKESSSKTDDVDGEILRHTRASKTNDTATECFHCKKIFPDHKSLIEHVYEIIEPKHNKSTDEQDLSKEKNKSDTGNSLRKNVSRDLCQTKNKENSKLSTKNVLNKSKHSESQRKAKETTGSSNKNVASIKTRPKRQDKNGTKKREERKEFKNNHSLDRKVQLRSRFKNNVDRTEESEYDGNQLKTPLNEINHKKSVHHKNTNKAPVKSKDSEKEKHVYVCPHCTYCFLIARNYIKHIKLKHDAKVPKLRKKLFDPKCNYCDARNINVILYNRHLSNDHPDLLVEKVTQQRKATKRLAKLKNNLRAFAFKSVLFRCVRCDIHFISAEAVKDHDGHMEILINWKCYICDLIFKKSDKKVHLKQHTLSNNFAVHVLDAEGLSSLLYKCTKCAIHFSEKSYLEHYQNCETETAASVYCKVCDFLINESDFIAHERAHNNVEDFSFNVVTSDIIFFEEIEGESDRRKKIMVESTERRKKLLDEALVYCPTCQCYMAYVRKIHSDGLCTQLIKHVCDICGIVMTNKCIDTHRKHHRMKDFNLQDLNFLDMDGNTIMPPIPAYPQCSICKVYFTSKLDIISHVCDDTQYSTCEVCQMNLSDAAFKLHKPFHYYKLQKSNKIIVKLPKSKKTAISSPKLNKVNAASVKSNKALPSKNNTKDTITPTKTLANKSESLIAKKVIHEDIGTLSKTQKFEKDQNELADDNDCNFVVVFTCNNCFVALDRYDKVVEHCQNHIASKKSLSPDLMLCSTCHLKFDSTFESHKHVHDSQKPIKKLTFDVKYFSFDNTVWLNHVFQSLSAKEINKIIGKSIYKDEHRLRLQISQHGPPHLTVYKCAKCSNIIATENLFKHAGCTDSNIRKIPCSNCGLKFISSVTRNQHQLIHMRYTGINLKSYNIVLFNHDKDSIAVPSQFILYQCRNCNGLLEKSNKEHKCDTDDLKKCSLCGLLLYSQEFNNHITEHRISPNFCAKNMKVILTGIRNETECVDSKALTPSFNGVMYDYTLHQCKHCEICVKNEQLIAKHVCILGIYRFKCHKCDFYFTEKAFKPHLKTHSIDSDFKKDNINIVQFDLKCDSANTTNENNHVEKKSDDSEKQDSKETEVSVVTPINNEPNIDENKNDEPKNEAKNAVTLYKCKCELHFVDKLNAIQHSEKCSQNQRCKKQICTKCNLFFNPSELFTHLVNHHKSSKNKYKIVEITDENIDGLKNIILYKCSKCELHFSTEDVAYSHFLVCEGAMKDSEECKKCNTTFDKTTFNFEEHCIICGKEYKIVLIDETNLKNPSYSTETPKELLN